MSEHEKKFSSAILNKPKPCWVATDDAKFVSEKNCVATCMNEEDTVESTLNDCNDTATSENVFRSSSNYDDENMHDDLCDELDKWFDEQLVLANDDVDKNAPPRF